MNSVEPRSIYVRWSDDGRFVRKWDYKPFDAATEYRAEPEEADFSGYVDTFDTPPPPLPSAEDMALAMVDAELPKVGWNGLMPAEQKEWLGRAQAILAIIQKGQSDARTNKPVSQEAFDAAAEWYEKGGAEQIEGGAAARPYAEFRDEMMGKIAPPEPNEHLSERICSILADDPICMGRVTAATVERIAALVSGGEG